MKNQSRVNEEKENETHRQETEEATGREKVSVGAIKKSRTQEIAIKLKIAESKDTKEKEKQRNMTENRNIKTGNTFSVSN